GMGSEPVAELLNVIPCHVPDGVPVGLAEAGVLPRVWLGILYHVAQLGVPTPTAFTSFRLSDVGCGRDESSELTARRSVLAHEHWPCDYDTVSRRLIGLR